MSESVEQPAVEQTPVATEEAAPVTTEATKSYVNEDGTFNRDAFPDDLGKHSSFDKWGNIEEYIKGSINQSKFVGQKAEEWWNSDDPDVGAKKAQILGIPDTADDYEVAYPEAFSGLPETNQDAIKAYFEDSAKWAHENGVPKELYEKFAARDLERATSVYNEQLQAQEDAFADATDALKQVWRGDQYEENVEKSDNMAKFLGMEILIPIMEANPEVRKAFFDGASKITSDDTIIEAKQKESFATLNEQLDDIDDKMLAYDGPTTDRAYQRMLDKKMAMLAKL